MHSTMYSKENYIEVIYILGLKKELIYNKDIVEYLDISRASVSNAINKLITKKYAYRDEKSIKLTEKGINLGKEIYEKHVFFSKFLISIGVEPSVANDEACKIEHTISKDTFLKIKKYILDNKNCCCNVNKNKED